MLRYRIATDPRGRHVVLPAWLELTPATETYATRLAAQGMADWFNTLAARERELNAVAAGDLGIAALVGEFEPRIASHCKLRAKRLLAETSSCRV